jgi:hypothetical protein
VNEARLVPLQTPGITWNNQTGNVAIDHYHKFKEDVALMKQLGIKYYRWAALGHVIAGVSQYRKDIPSASDTGRVPAMTLSLPMSCMMSETEICHTEQLLYPNRFKGAA